MLAKNAAIFTFTGIVPESIADALTRCPFRPCGPTDAISRGFVPPIEGEDAISRMVGRVAVFAMREDEKLLPACVVNAEHKRKVQEIASRQARRVGRKESNEIRQRVTEELLAKAFIKTGIVHAWLDFDTSLLVVDSTADSKIGSLVGLLVRQFDPVPRVLRWRTNETPATHFTHWVHTAEAPANFTLDDRALLTHPEGGQVRLTKQSVVAQEVRPLIEHGRSCVELAMTYDQRV